MKITIITVVFNDKEGLLKTIQSLREQTFDDFEYIVIDGSSTDSTLQILQEQADIINQVVSEIDKGIYDAMNKGIGLANGEYVNFMNAGDTFADAHVLSQVVREIQLDCCSSHIYYGDHFVHGSRRNDGLVKAKIINKILKGMVCCHQSMFFSLEVLKNQYYSLDFGTAADYELVLRLYKNGSKFSRMVGLPIVNYSAGGISDTRRVRSLLWAHQAVKTHGYSTLITEMYLCFKLFRAFLVDHLSWRD